MPSELEVSWVQEDGVNAAWQTEHLFGWDVSFGQKRDGYFVPCRTVTLTRPMSAFEKQQVRRALYMWTMGDWAWLQRMLADLASGAEG